MKNKKGFTLIELLAVVVIIGILLLIAVPAVSRYLTKGTTQYYNSLEDSVLLAGREYLNDYEVLLPREIGNVTIIELNELISNNYIEDVVDSDGNVCNGQVAVKKIAKNKYEYYSCLDCGEEYTSDEENCGFSENDNVTTETKNYTIEVEQESYTVSQGSTFELPKAKAYYLGQLVDSNVVPSPRLIDTNKLGTTTVTYSYQGAKKQITVKVVDQVSPSIPQIVLKYDDQNGNNYRGQWYSGSIYAEFKSTDYTKQGLNGIGISHYELSTDQKNWQQLSSNNYTVNIDGDLYYYVRSVDKAGNISQINSFNVKIDSKTPKCKILANGEEVTDDKWFTDDVTLSLKVEETPSGIFNEAISKNSITVNTTGETITGIVTSNAGKVATCSAVIKLDKTRPDAPTITASDSKASGSWHNSDFNLTYSGASNVSGNTYYYGTTTNPTTKGSSTSISTNTEGTTYYVKVCSGAGLCSTTNSSYLVKLDKTPPTAPTITGGSTSWSATAKTISVSTEAKATSGISYYQYCISTSTSGCNGTWTNLAAGTKSVSISTNGTRYIYFRGVSGVGILGTASAYQTTMIDTVQPTITAKAPTNYITQTTGAAITGYFTITTGDSGQSTVCKVGSTTVSNTNNLSLGINTVTCTTTNGAGITSSASTTFRHQYSSTVTCSKGTLNSSKTSCNYSDYVRTDYSCPSGYSLSGTTCSKTETQSASCQLDPKCTLYKVTVTCKNNATVLSSETNIPASSTNSECSRLVNSYATTCLNLGGPYCSTTSLGEQRHSACGSKVTVTGSECGNLASCPSGWTKSGYTCSKTTTQTATGTPVYNSGSVTPNYSCPTTGVNGNTGAAVSATASGLTCSF